MASHGDNSPSCAVFKMKRHNRSCLRHVQTSATIFVVAQSTKTQFPRNFSFVIYVPVQIFGHTFPASPDIHIFTGLIPVLNIRTVIVMLHLPVQRWLGSRVVSESVLDSSAERSGLKSHPRRCRVTVLGKLFTPIVPLFTKERNWQQPS